ncbi:MAG TPA: hypothetical protein VN878_06125 [Usitatibacter sp.]|nr:hypothetical protein [Usitatibacter sp.]
MVRAQKLISAGFAIAALASASIPALGWTVWRNVDLEGVTFSRAQQTSTTIYAERAGALLAENEDAGPSL